MSINFKTILTVFIFLLGINGLAQINPSTVNKVDQNPKTIEKIKLLSSKITKDNIYATLIEFIKATRPSRFVGTSGHKNTSTFLLEYIGKIKGANDLLWVDEFVPEIDHAIKVYNQDFENQIVGKYSPSSVEYKKADRLTKSTIATLKNFKGLKGKNVIWEKKGTKNPDEILILGGHIDTIVVNSNTSSIETTGSMSGADNNASGISVLLSLVSILSKLDIEKTVRIVFFDFETLGFLGSRSFVEKYYDELVNGKKKMIGFVNVLMLGHDSSDEDQKKQTGNMKIYTRKQNAKDAILANQMNVRGSQGISGINFSIDANDFPDGSNTSFWEKDLPAIAMTENWEDDSNPLIHTSNDLIETLNIGTLYKAYQHISLAVMTFAFDIKK